MITKLEKKFREAAENRLLCEVTDAEGRVRVVAPLGEFITQHHHKCFATYQYSGYSSEKLPNFRSLPVSDYKKIKILDIKFNIRKDFNPGNNKTYYKWIWHLPVGEFKNEELKMKN